MIAEPGLVPVAIRGDGLVVAISVREPAIVVVEPDGSRRAVPVPAEVGSLHPDNWAFVRGDLFIGSALAGSALRPVDPSGNARRLADPGSVVWISAGGTVMIANTPTGPVTWRC